MHNVLGDVDFTAINMTIELLPEDILFPVKVSSCNTDNEPCVVRLYTILSIVYICVILKFFTAVATDYTLGLGLQHL